MTKIHVRHLVLLLIFGLSALSLIRPPVAEAENAVNVKVRIDHYTHSGCMVGGERLKPPFASDGGAAFFWLPRQRQSCLDTIKRFLHWCKRATSFATNTDDEKYPGCLPVFAAESGSCISHYNLEKQKCDQGPESHAGSEKEQQELEEERERLALEEERERLALEEERERLALEQERQRLAEEQRLAQRRQELEEQQRRQRLAQQQREREEGQRLLAQQQRDRESQRLAKEMRETDRRSIAQQQARLRAKKRRQDNARNTIMGLMKGVAGGLAELNESGNSGMAILKGLADGLKASSSKDLAGVSGDGGAVSGSCEQAQRRIEQRLAAHNRNLRVGGMGMCAIARYYVRMLQEVRGELAGGGCPAHAIRTYDRSIAQARQTARASCN